MSDRRNIVLVETDEDIQRDIEQLLRPYGFNVHSFSDRWRAFRAIKRKRDFHAVLIDHDLAGIGVLRTLFANMLRDLDKSMRFVVLIDHPEAFDTRPFDEHDYPNLLPKSDISDRLAGMLRNLGAQAASAAVSPRKKTTRTRSRALAGAC